MKVLEITILKEFEIPKKILTSWQFILYKRSVNALVSLISASAKGFMEYEDGLKTIFRQVDEEAIIEMRLKEWERFMYSDEEELKHDKYAKYSHHLRNTWIEKVKRKGKKYRQKVIKKALGEGNIVSFFSNIGILISWRVSNL